MLQAKCDELEEQGVLINPKQHDIDVRLVSPCFVTQKPKSKSKSLSNCTLNELRFVTNFCLLNDHIHPIHSRTTTFTDLSKFLARHKFFIFFDLTNSYFQIKMSSSVLPYLGVMTPNRGIRVLTRAGQGLQNSDYELEQLLTQILGDEICQDKVIISRDDGIVGANSMEELIDHWEIVLSKLKLNNMKAAASKL